MKTKEKLNEALELLTQLRVDLMKVGEESLEEKANEIEMIICKSIDILNNVGLADVSGFTESDMKRAYLDGVNDVQEIPFNIEYYR